jgi:hypothetical protein
MKINAKEKEIPEKGRFIPRRRMGAFETGIYRSVRCVAHTRTSYLVKPVRI